MLELTVTQVTEIIPPGALLCTRDPASDLSGAIAAGESLESGQVASWGHAMRMDRNGMANSQETRRKRLPLANWVGCYLRAYINPAYDQADYDLLLDAAELRLGTRYDWIGTGLGQVVRWVPFIGDWLASIIDVPWTNYCSEGECEIERKAFFGFMGDAECQVSPQDIDDWCRRAGWKLITFKLVADTSSQTPAV